MSEIKWNEWPDYTNLIVPDRVLLWYDVKNVQDNNIMQYNDVIIIMEDTWYRGV